MRLYDANVTIGSPMRANPNSVSGPDALLAAMDSLGIKRALVRHTAQIDAGPVVGNPLLTGVVQSSDRFAGVWAILPPQTGEFVPQTLFDDMKNNRITALQAFPEDHKYLLRREVFGAFLDEVSERRIPFIYSVDDRRTRWHELYDLMKDYPELTCIVCDVGHWGVDRFTWPLLESYPNLYVETSYVSLEAGGLDAGIAKYGADRFIHGSGFPLRYPEASVMDLLHAKCSDEDRAMIAWKNLDDLMENAQL